MWLVTEVDNLHVHIGAPYTHQGVMNTAFRQPATTCDMQLRHEWVQTVLRCKGGSVEKAAS
jgi:hypothetical protein